MSASHSSTGQPGDGADAGASASTRGVGPSSNPSGMRATSRGDGGTGVAPRRIGKNAAPPHEAQVFRQGSSVCIFELFPEEHMNRCAIHLELFAQHCPVNTPECPGIIGLKYGALERGVLPTKKASADKGENNNAAGNRFQHQVQLRMRLAGAENISVKFFKTGRLQTAGCRTRAMSAEAVKDVAAALAIMARNNICVVANCSPELGLELAAQAPAQMRVVKECILGSFVTGFGGPQGNTIDMGKLHALLSSSEMKDYVERVKFNDDPGSHEAKFKQLGLFLKKTCLPDSETDVFVNVFSSGKCTVTAAASTHLARQVMGVVTDLLCSNYNRIVLLPSEKTAIPPPPPHVSETEDPTPPHHPPHHLEGISSVTAQTQGMQRQVQGLPDAAFQGARIGLTNLGAITAATPQLTGILGQGAHIFAPPVPQLTTQQIEAAVKLQQLQALQILQLQGLPGLSYLQPQAQLNPAVVGQDPGILALPGGGAATAAAAGSLSGAAALPFPADQSLGHLYGSIPAGLLLQPSVSAGQVQQQMLLQPQQVTRPVPIVAQAPGMQGGVPTSEGLSSHVGPFYSGSAFNTVGSKRGHDQSDFAPPGRKRR